MTWLEDDDMDIHMSYLPIWNPKGISSNIIFLIYIQCKLHFTLFSGQNVLPKVVLIRNLHVM